MHRRPQLCSKGRAHPVNSVASGGRVKERITTNEKSDHLLWRKYEDLLFLLVSLEKKRSSLKIPRRRRIVEVLYCITRVKKNSRKIKYFIPNWIKVAYLFITNLQQHFVVTFLLTVTDFGEGSRILFECGKCQERCHPRF